MQFAKSSISGIKTKKKTSFDYRIPKDFDSTSGPSDGANELRKRIKEYCDKND